MAYSLGLSKRKIVWKIFFPALKRQLPLFIVNSLISLLSPLVICGTLSNYGIGGHFFTTFRDHQSLTYLWLADSIVILAFVVFLLYCKGFLEKKKL